nr:immunoglobulin light chain junction region [Macaca mulatta]MOV68228.1 immunoglobulin light chain junction region [Macaca mulatta]MOV69245.1 immunoglobulin light chain junction region [Macaca mulatta]MOV69318.1 immunoglobulin light chain junction region [Macaca mulatta]MOV70898.1 immunoglobulin light chain junction region [Macaca mulatta]
DYYCQMWGMTSDHPVF